MSLANDLALDVSIKLCGPRAPARLAVFLSGDKDSIRMTRPESSLFFKAFATYPRRLVGVYDKRAHPRDIADDLRYMGLA
jgi:hypothetical protein